MIDRVDAMCKRLISEHAILEPWCRLYIEGCKTGKLFKRIVLIRVARSLLDDVVELQELIKEIESYEHLRRYAEEHFSYFINHRQQMIRTRLVGTILPKIYRKLRLLVFAEYGKHLALHDSLETISKIFWLIKHIEINGIQIPMAENRPMLLAYAEGTGMPGDHNMNGHDMEQTAVQDGVVPRPAKDKNAESGTGVSRVDSQPVTVSSVDFCAIAPDVLVKGAYSLVNLVIYETGNEAVIQRIRSTYKQETTTVEQGSYEIGRDTVISVRIHSREQGVVFRNAEVTHVWKDKKLVFQFMVFVSELYNGQQIPLELTVFFNGLKASELFLVVNCNSKVNQELQISRKDVLSGFASYSSRDRSEVMKRIQGMKKARPDLSIFCDVDSLRSGEDWQNRIREELDRRDVLFLFWSSNASKSKWVDFEWRYVYENKGIEYIDPVPLELPDVCSQPEELKAKHFSDRYLYYTKS